MLNNNNAHEVSSSSSFIKDALYDDDENRDFFSTEKQADRQQRIELVDFILMSMLNSDWFFFVHL